MPRFDKTGPEGKGPMTGRGLGKCAPSKSSANRDEERLSGRGRGSGRRGRGRGFFGFFRRRSEEDITETE